MQSSVQSLGELARCRGAKLLGIGSLVGLSALLAAVTGCPPPVVDEPTPCTTNAECEDNQACVDGACQDVECNDNGDCDDSLVCTEDVCDAALFTCSNPPIDGCCTTNGECDEVGGETCDIPNNVCVTPECTTNAECSALDDQCNTGTCTDFACVATPVTDGTACDDGDECLDPDTCTAGACGGGTAVICDDLDDCSADTCDSATPGGCVFTLDPDCCTDAADCADLADDCNTADCVASVCVVTPVLDGTACDDAEACTDPDTCTAGVCGGTAVADCCSETVACPTGTTCDLPSNTCVGGALDFTLTDGEVLNGSAGDDVFTATVGTLQPLDIAVGNGGNDTLNASITGALSSGVTLIDIDTINFTTLGSGTTFDAVGLASIGTINVTGTSGVLTLDNLEAGVALGLDSGYDQTLTVVAIGGTDVGVTLNGTAAGAQLNLQQPVMGTLNLTLNGDSTLTSNGGADFLVGATISEVVVDGTGNLTLADVSEGDFAYPTVVDGTGLTGDVTVSVIDDDTDHTFDFSDGAAEQVLGIDSVVVNDDTTQNYSFTFDVTDGPVSIDISSIVAADAAGTLMVFWDGTNEDDTVTVNLGGDGDGVGAITATTTDSLTVVSTGTGPKEIATGSSIGVNGFGAGVVQKTVTVLGDQDLDMGIFTADVIDGAGFDAALTVEGSADDNVISGGPGDDTLRGGDGLDILTGNDGVDALVLGYSADADQITDFVSGTAGDHVDFDLTELEAALATNYVLVGAGATDIAASTVSEVQELAGADAATATATVFVLTGATFAATTDVETELEDTGTYEITTDGNVAAADSFIVVYSNGTHAFVANVYSTAGNTGTTFAAADLVVTNIARFNGVTSIDPGVFVSENFDFVD